MSELLEFIEFRLSINITNELLEQHYQVLKYQRKISDEIAGSNERLGMYLEIERLKELENIVEKS